MSANGPSHSAPASSPVQSWSEALGACLAATDEHAGLAAVLAAQCTLAGAEAGALVALPGFAVLTVYPEPPPLVIKDGKAVNPMPLLPTWLSQIAPALGKEDWKAPGRAPLVIPVHEQGALYGAVAQQVAVVLPLSGGKGVEVLGVYYAKREQAEALRKALAEVSVLYRAHATLRAARQHGTAHLSKAMSVLAAVGEHPHFKAAALAFCNQMAAATGARRVSLGVANGRRVKMLAASHTDRIERHAQVTQRVEAVMDECLDQDVEIPWPTAVDMLVISRMAAEHAKQQSLPAVVSFPLRRAGKPVGALSLDLPEPLAPQAAEMVRLACELAAPLLIKSHEADRWFGARWQAEIKRLAGLVVGPRYALAKVAAICGLIAIVLLLTLKGPDRVDAPFQLVASERRVLSAPFEGVLGTVNAQVGDPVEQDGAELAEFRTIDLRLKLASSRAEQAQHVKEADLARRENKTADALIAEAQAARLDADAKWLEYQISQASIRSPISGVVVEGIDKTRAGNAMQRGDKLFEVAKIESLYAELHVKESRITEVREGQVGELSTTGRPDLRVPFTVTRIEPMAEVADGENVFRVRVKLEERPPWLLPGMAGVAKIEVGRSLYSWMWTRSAVNWVRMKMWW